MPATRRRRGGTRQQDERTDVSMLIRPITIIMSGILAWFHQPMLLLLACGFLLSAAVVQHPELTGRDAFRQTAPADQREQRMLERYHRVRAWAAWRDYDPTKPVFLFALGVGSTLGLAHSAWWMWGVDTLGGMMITLMLFGRLRRPYTRIPIRVPHVTYTVKRLPRMGILAGVGLLVGVLFWAWLGDWRGFVTFPILFAPCAYVPQYQRIRRLKRDDMASARQFADWLDAIDKPPVSARPTLVADTRLGAHGERMFLLSATPVDQWVARKTRDLFRPLAARDGLDVAFVLNGDDRTRVLVNIATIKPPAPASLLADETGLRCRLNMETARLGFNYSTLPGKASTSIIGHNEQTGEPSVIIYRILGPQPDWHDVSVSWLRGSTDGELGDWGTMIGLRMLVDPSLTFAWVSDGNPVDAVFDDEQTKRYRCQSFSTTGSTRDYLSYVQRSKTDMETISNALKRAKLPDPPNLYYDTLSTVQGNGYVLESLTMSISREGGVDVSDYMSVDMRASMGDATIADMLPVSDGRGGWYRRYMRLVRTIPPQSPKAPTRLRDCVNDDEATRLCARIIVSRAFGLNMKHAPLVSEGVRLTRQGSFWRFTIRLVGGVIVADVQRIQARLQAVMGADTTLWRWEENGIVTLWAGGMFPQSRLTWLHGEDWAEATRIRLDNCWLNVGAVTRGDGRTFTTIGIQPAHGILTRISFREPAGMDVDRVLDTRLDAFLSAAGYRYAKRIPDDHGLTLLVADRDPLPERCTPDWSLLDSTRYRIPFGVGDDGLPAFWDVNQTPHLLASGTTGSGKSSVSMTIVAAALRLGWMVAVTDPEKGANDFRPIRNRLSAFEDSWEGCAALIHWAYVEMQRRVRLIGDHGGGDLSSIPEMERPKPLLIQIDEFNSLLGREPVARSRNMGPEAVNETALSVWRNGLRERIGLEVSKILKEGRSARIMLLLGAQKLNAGALSSMPDAGTATGMLGRVFLGGGDTAGVITIASQREANRMLRAQTRTGGLPKGRGVYEPLGGGVSMVQCWYSGKDEEFARQCAGVPDPVRLNVDEYRPEKPRLIGLQEEPTDEGSHTVEATLDADGLMLD